MTRPVLCPDDVIAAIASPPGPAARAIVRVSGGDVVRVLSRVFTPVDDAAWSGRSRRRHPGHVVLPLLSTPLTADLYLWLGRRSYTGEPLAELHTIGSPPLVEAVLSAVYAAGARPAEPGEFTLRAFLAGRLDLLQAEAVLGVIDATSAPELQQSLEQLAGGASSRMRGLRQVLLDLLADLEAGLDFADEDLQFVSQRELANRLTDVRDQLRDLAARTRQRTVSEARRRVVLAGPANAGKSTLFNALAGRDLALVSAHPGTTRDYLTAEVDCQGLSIVLVDTAGHDASIDTLSAQAHGLREAQLRQADLVLWCLPADSTHFAGLAPPGDRPVIHVETKADLSWPGARAVPDACRVSAQAGTGLAELVEMLGQRLRVEGNADSPLIGSSAARCLDALRGALDALERARDLALSERHHDLLALEIRDALDELGRVVGAVYTDDLLDRIFSRFCIGK